MAWFVLVATIPAGIAGLLGENVIAPTTSGEPWQILILLSAGALLLYWADRSPQTRRMGDLGLRQAVVMGLAQALALAPGVSRSGITITAGRFMRLDRDGAARFSFYLLIPTVLGAVLLRGRQGRGARRPPERLDGPVPGRHALAALGSGLLAIEWLLGYVRRHTLRRVRRVPARRRRARPGRDRERTPRRDVLSVPDGRVHACREEQPRANLLAANNALQIHGPPVRRRGINERAALRWLGRYLAEHKRRCASSRKSRDLAGHDTTAP